MALSKPIADLSIISTAYNVAAYLPDFFESVLQQSVLPKEIIVVDDCSTDETRAVAELYAEAYPDLVRVVLADKNGGVAATRNLGIRHVTTNWIQIVDPDDVLHDRGVIERIDRSIRETSPDVIRLNFARFETEIGSGKNIYSSGPRWRLEGHTGVTNVERTPDLLWTQNFWQLVYSKAFLERHDLRFNPEQRRREDWSFLFGALARAETVAILDGYCIKYRARPDSITQKKKPEDMGYCVSEFVSTRASLKAANAEARPIRHHVDLRMVISLMWTCLDFIDVIDRDEMLALLGQWREAFLKDVIGAHTFAEWKKRSASTKAPFDLAGIVTEADVRRGFTAITRSTDAFHDLCREIKTGKDRKKDAKGARPFGPKPFDLQGRHLFLHVGMAKTGTTAFQRFLLDVQPQIKGRVCFPHKHISNSGDYRHGPGHLFLFQGLAFDTNQLEVRETLQEIRESPAPAICLSCELLADRFFFRDPEFQNRIRAFFVNGPISVLMVRRDPFGHALSLYKEDVISPGRRYVADPLCYLRNIMSATGLDQDQAQADYEALFGAENTHVLRLEDHPGTIVQRLAGVIDPALEPLAAERDNMVHMSIDDSLAPVGRIANRQPSETGALRRTLRKMEPVERADDTVSLRARTMVLILKGKRREWGYPDWSKTDEDRASSRVQALMGDPVIGHIEEVLEREAYLRDVTSKPKSGLQNLSLPALKDLIGAPADLLIHGRRPRRDVLVTYAALLLVGHYLYLLAR